MNNVLRLPTESSHFQTFVLPDRIAAEHLSLTRRSLHLPVKQSTWAAPRVMDRTAAAGLVLRSQDKMPTILWVD
jgi:hypothetical protein